MLTFAHPWLFLLIAAPLLARWLLPAHREPGLAVRVPFLDRLAALTGQTPGSGATIKHRDLTQWLLLAFWWLCLVSALARPQWLEPPIVRELPSRDLLLAVDLSGSMATEDFTDPSGAVIDRLAAVKQVLTSFLAARDGDRVGLVFFGSAPFAQAPFTDDLEVVQELLQEAQVGMLGPRTMMGDAMGLGINMFERSEVEQRVMIVLTDGNDTGSSVPPVRAAEIAADEDVMIHTVAIGDPSAAGEQALDEVTLRAIAASTGGGYFRAEDRTEMEAIYDELDRLNPRQVETLSFQPQRDLFFWPLGLALGSGLLFFGLLVLRRPRVNLRRETTG